ncbi:MAG: nucleotide exchange factor GrpE [Kiritimatiellae bacterium]|nr:nucleotide exchange factor GrpE [Kiritimatiellia bacterium]
MAKNDKEEKRPEEAQPESADRVSSVPSGFSDSGDTGDSSEPSEPSNSGDSSDPSDPSVTGDAKSADSKDPKSDAKPESPAEPDWKSLYAITLADFDNYKKRAARDREDVYRYAESDILKDILPVVDNLALALEHAKDKANEFVKGVQLVYDGLLKALADHGAKPMADLVGKELDPNFHEAIATLPDEKIEEGKISNVAKTGWTLNDKLLRAAQVVVSTGRPAEAK